jgi:hypothetical protein
MTAFLTQPCWTALVLACLAAHAGAAQPAAPASAAPATSTPSATLADAVYQRERAACGLDGTPQGRITCLKEAGAAHAEAKRNQLGNGEGEAALRQNAELRCNSVAAADRDHCQRMARGEGMVSGSVAGGGVLKTLITTVPAVAPAACR